VHTYLSSNSSNITVCKAYATSFNTKFARTGHIWIISDNLVCGCDKSAVSVHYPYKFLVIHSLCTALFTWLVAAVFSVTFVHRYAHNVLPFTSVHQMTVYPITPCMTPLHRRPRDISWAFSTLWLQMLRITDGQTVDDAGVASSRP